MDLTIYTEQLETYLNNHGIDASVEFNATTNCHIIKFMTTKERTISVDFDDILTDYALVASMIRAYMQLDQEIKSDSTKCQIKQIDSNKISIELTVRSGIKDTNIQLASGTELFIKLIDPYAFLEMTFSRSKTVSRATLNSELNNEVQAIIADVKQYCVQTLTTLEGAHNERTK